MLGTKTLRNHFVYAFCKLNLKYNPHWIAAPDVGNQPPPIGNLWGLIQIQHRLCALAAHTHFNGNCPKIPASHRDINRNYLHFLFPQRDIQFKILFYLDFLPQSTNNIRMRLQNPVRDGVIWLCIIYPALYESLQAHWNSKWISREKQLKTEHENYIIN